jgi:Tfp pilus assembly protein PilX
MLKEKKLEEFSSVKIKECSSNSVKTILQLRQKGSILIGLIVTMVVMASLGAGMVYLTTTSTFQELFANNHARAYYAAESGGRYAMAKIRDAYAQTTTIARDAILATIPGTYYDGTAANNKGNFVISPLTPTGSPATVVFTSTGTVNSGFLQAKRRLSYSIQPANQAAVSVPPIPPEQPLAINDFIKSGSTASGQFDTVSNIDGGSALKVTQTTSGSGSGNQPSTEAYVSPPGGDPNFFYVAWYNTKGFLSYDAQVKIALGEWDDGEWDNEPHNYAAGLMVRARDPGQQEKFYGLSFIRTNSQGGDNTDGIKDTMVPDHNCPSGGCANRAMIMLWTRNSNAGNGDDNWLAYQLLDESDNESDYVVDHNGHLKPWSTILIRVVEAASVKLSVSSAPLISLGAYITDAAGKNAKVVRKINDSDGYVVLLLDTVDDGFTRPLNISGYATNTTWGFRAKDAYIWAFYGHDDTSHNSSNETPLKTTPEKRLNNPRDPSTSATDTSPDLHWLPTDIKDWTPADDYFTLVRWNANPNTDQDSLILRMGTGKELNGIIRTSKWVTGTYYPPAYTNDTFPPEFGVNALGKTATHTYYDNIGLYLYGLPGGGGTGGTGQVIVSP